MVPSKFVNFLHVKVLIYIKTENSLPSSLNNFTFRFTNDVNLIFFVFPCVAEKVKNISCTEKETVKGTRTTKTKTQRQDKGKEMKDEGHTNVLYCTKQRPLYIIIFVHNCSHTLCRNIWISSLSRPHICR